MIELIQSLFAHVAWADAAILKAVAAHDGASADEDVRKWLLHMVTVQSFFLSMFQQRTFDMGRWKQAPGTMDELERQFAEAHADGGAYTARLDEAELARTIEFPVPPWKDFHPPVRDALMQVASQWEKVAVLRLGRYAGLRGPGLFHIVPIVDSLSRFVDQRVRVASLGFKFRFPYQPADLPRRGTGHASRCEGRVSSL
jgi:hypothetical protein